MSQPASSKDALLKTMELALSQHPQLQLARGAKSDLEISSVLADYHWPAGKKRVEFSARLLAKEAEHTVVYWEMIKEVGTGIRGIFAGFRSETYKSDGKTLSGEVREVGWAPGGKAIDYDWDYSQTRTLVEQVAKAHGWRFATTLWKGKAER